MAVARQQFHGKNCFFPDALLPTGAGDIEKRLLQAVRGHHERAGCRARGHRARGGIVERVHLLLVLCLPQHRKIQRNIVNAPADGKFSAAVCERQIVDSGARLHQCLVEKLVPISTQTDLCHPTRTDCPVVLDERPRKCVILIDNRIPGKRRPPHQLLRCVKRLNFAACALLVQQHHGNICPG